MRWCFNAPTLGCCANRTGQSWCEPNDVKAKTYNVTVEPGGTLAKGPFKAETLSVAVERDYVIVEM